MTDTVETQIDEILMKHNGELGVTWESPDVVTPDTKQAIKDLIATEVLHARRDEVERFLVEPGEAIPYNNNTFADGFRYVIDKLQARLAELEAQLGSK